MEAEEIRRTLDRIEAAHKEWESNQRWQLNQIREELKAIGKIAAWVGVAVITSASAYLWRLW